MSCTRSGPSRLYLMQRPLVVVDSQGLGILHPPPSLLSAIDLPPTSPLEAVDHIVFAQIQPALDLHPRSMRGREGKWIKRGEGERMRHLHTRRHHHQRCRLPHVVWLLQLADWCPSIPPPKGLSPSPCTTVEGAHLHAALMVLPKGLTLAGMLLPSICRH
jgi:hypothetical protein